MHGQQLLFEISAEAAIASINSDLFTLNPLFLIGSEIAPCASALPDEVIILALYLKCSSDS